MRRVSRYTVQPKSPPRPQVAEIQPHAGRLSGSGTPLPSNTAAVRQTALGGGALTARHYTHRLTNTRGIPTPSDATTVRRTAPDDGAPTARHHTHRLTNTRGTPTPSDATGARRTAPDGGAPTARHYTHRFTNTRGIPTPSDATGVRRMVLGGGVPAVCPPLRLQFHRRWWRPHTVRRRGRASDGSRWRRPHCVAAAARRGGSPGPAGSLSRPASPGRSGRGRPAPR